MKKSTSDFRSLVFVEHSTLTRIDYDSIAMLLLLIGLIAGCPRSGHDSGLSRLREALKSPGQFSAHELAQYCEKAGPQGAEIVRSAVLTAENANDRHLLLRALLKCDVDGQLPFVIGKLARPRPSQGTVQKVMERCLVPASRRFLQERVTTATGDELVVVLGALALVADDRESLELAKQQFHRPDLDPETTIAALHFLAHAAHFNRDESAASEVRGYLYSEDGGIRMHAVLALSMIPGKEADSLLAEALSDPAQGYAAAFRDGVLKNRKSMLETESYTPPGWAAAVQGKDK
ncbi:MAG: hypothetical protein J5J06_01560 [Phycisphaerae bacterium]|nr:hypothetical protein [Phycisphaerae bacterium]